MKFRLSVLKFALANGVAKAVNKYHLNRQFIYRLKWRYDGTAESLLPKSRRPNHHPNEHTEEEIALIKDMRTKYPYALVQVKMRGVYSLHGFTLQSYEEAWTL